MSIDFRSILSRADGVRAPAPSQVASAGEVATGSDFQSLVRALQSSDVGTARSAPGLGDNAASETRAATAVSSQAIDYMRFVDMTPFEVYMANASGLPAGWDWAAWAESAGRPNPGMTDVSGAALGPDGFRVDTPDANRANFDRAQAGFDWDRTGAWLAREGLDGSVHTMTINPPHDWTGVIELATSQTASSLGGCAGVQCVVTDAAGHVVYSTQGYESAAGSGGRFRVSGADGPFTWTVTYAGAGQQTFNCLHHP